VDPITVDANIDRPRAEVFEYLADIANHPEFQDHYKVDWHLTREESYGDGAGARYKVEGTRNRFPWADATLAEIEPGRRIVERGRMGKFNRIQTLTTYELTDGSGDGTRVRMTFESRPKTMSDKFLESLGARGARRRHMRKAARRLTSILEEDRGRGRRATISGGARKPATAYRFR
jgi:uncharacterized protein YndB with AHSA1/START domain